MKEIRMNVIKERRIIEAIIIVELKKEAKNDRNERDRNARRI